MKAPGVQGTVHVVGAGVAGLSAATELAEAGRLVAVYEAAPNAGGRCRSYFDTTLGAEIDNGNHLVLSGNRAAAAYLDRIGARAKLSGPDAAAFPFFDLRTGARWVLQPNRGRLPWWLLSSARRAPGTKAWDYLGAARLLLAGAQATVGDCVATRGAVWDRVWHPILLSALNTEPEKASARLAAAIILETLGAGGGACRPLIAHDGLTAAFVAPALRYLEMRGSSVAMRQRLVGLAVTGRRATALRFDDRTLALGPEDAVILAVPPGVARTLIPGLAVPDAFRSIANIHFRVDAPAGAPAMLGIVNGLAEWIFTFKGRVAVTISGADRLLGLPRDQLAGDVWRDVSRALGFEGGLPPWQIIFEKRATFAALPEQNAKRATATASGLANVALAGDWTATGLPATIEGAVRSGRVAAAVVQDATLAEPGGT